MILSNKNQFVMFIAIVTIGLIVTPEWILSFNHWLLFNVLFSLMLTLSFTRPISLIYTFFSFFLFLGFWGKLIFHFATYVKDTGKGWVDSGNAGRYIEPIGAFDGMPLSWDNLIIVCIFASLGMLLARALHIALSLRETDINHSGDKNSLYKPSKQKYVIWLISLISFLALLIVNYHYSFYQIGINPKVVLPYHLNVIVSWTIAWGGGLFFGLLAYDQIKKNSQANYFMLVLLLAISCCVTLSTMSRSTYLFYGASYLFGWLQINRNATNKTKGVAVALFIFGLMASIVLVQVLRATNYFDNIASLSQPASITTKKSVLENKIELSSPIKKENSSQKNSYVIQMLQQTPYLILNRWVGLEALMSVVSYKDKSIDSLKKAITDNPSLGVDSMFQRISNAKYEKSEKFTFMTLAGPVALLYISGSYLVVTSGMFVLMMLLITIEYTVRKYIPNPFIAWLIATSTAFTCSQTTFPYLTMVFIIQIAITMLLMYILSKTLTKTN
jgi:hypothetical protein